MEKSVAEKAHIKPGSTIAVLNQVPGVVESLGLRPLGLVSADELWSAFRFKHGRTD